MKKKTEQEQPQVDCSNCGGTGKVNKDSAGKSESETPASYPGGTCPVCGGSGKVTAPTIEASEKQRNCFVATVAFGDPDCEELNLLRAFRDEKLMPRRWGRSFVKLYYRVGPGIARYVESKPKLKARVKQALAAVCTRLARRQALNRRSSRTSERS